MVFKNKFKKENKHPDYIVRDPDKNVLGVGWDKTDKHGEVFQAIIINEDGDDTNTK